MDRGLFSEACAFAQPTFSSVLLNNEHPSVQASSSAGVTPYLTGEDYSKTCLLPI
jgi:hypothetical protein